MVHVTAGVFLLLLIFLTGGAPSAAAERLVRVDDLKVLAGEWQGSLSGVRGGTVPFTLSVSEDGTWKGLSPNGPSNGTLRLEHGVIRWSSQTTGRRGTITVHEDDGKRILRLQAEGGASFEVSPK